MMRSLRTRLLAGTMLVSAIVLGVLGITLDQAARRTLHVDFDRVLLEKARSLASMVEQERGRLHFDYEQSQFPEFEKGPHPAYFEILLNGQTYWRSASLGSDHLVLPKNPTGVTQAPLPGGVSGRLLVLNFLPYTNPRFASAEQRDPAPPRGLLLVAQDTRDLDRTLSRIRWLTFGLCGIACLLCGGALLAVVGRAIRPVSVLALQIESMDEKDLHATLVPGDFPTELAPIAERLNGLLDRVRAAFHRERAFTADVAHELRTPLAGLLATLEVCRTRPRDAAGYELAIDKCLAMLGQMQRLVENLLLLARAESGQLSVRGGPVNLPPLVQECWCGFEDRARGRRISFSCEADPELHVMGDGEFLRIVFNNLFDNAISYSRDGGDISLRIFPSGLCLAIEVANTGHALVPGDLDRLFDRFWRKDSARSANGLHAGLGLSLCQRLVMLQGGEISVRLEGDRFVAAIQMPQALRPAAALESCNPNPDLGVQGSPMAVIRSEPLNQEELAQYRNEGWVRIGRVMDDATLDNIRAEEARFRGDPGQERCVFRSQLSHYSAIIRDYIVTGPQVAMAKQLVGLPNVAIWFNQMVTKLPDGDSGKSEFPWHQDNGYVAIEPATNVTIWVALDDVDENNGCVWVLPGSHHGGLLPHQSKSSDSWHLKVDVAGDGVPARLKAGEAVAFTGLTLHRSKLNHTDVPRRAFFMEYTDPACTYRRRNQEPQPVLQNSNTWLVVGQARWTGKASY